MKINTRESLIADLKRSGINPHGTLLVHSSVKSVGKCEDKGNTIIDAFIEFMQDGLLLFPTHTWDAVTSDGFDENGVPIGENNVYDPVNMVSCVGILSNIFLKRDGVMRSLHPTHSVAAIGRDAKDFIAGEEFTRSPCPRNGCYGKLYDRKAQILFMGCDLSKNTYLHAVEEWNNIPNRLTEKPQEIFIRLNDQQILCPQRRHYFDGGDVSENYIKAERLFIEKGAAVYCKIGSAHSVLCDAVKMADLIGDKLKENPNLFADNSDNIFNKFEFKEVNKENEKSKICNDILRALPSWFGIEASIVDYVEQVKQMPFYAAFDCGIPIGFVAIKKHNVYTAEVCVMGVLNEYHRQGIGKNLIKCCDDYCRDNRIEFLTVKTLDKSRESKSYEKTRLFYQSVGFKPLEVFPLLWDKANPCLFMAKYMKG